MDTSGPDPTRRIGAKPSYDSDYKEEAKIGGEPNYFGHQVTPLKRSDVSKAIDYTPQSIMDLELNPDRDTTHIVNPRKGSSASKTEEKARFFFAPEKDTTYADPNKLLISAGSNSAPFKQMDYEWEINFGLLLSTYKKAKDPQMKEHIKFLMTNYLQKAAYTNQNVTFFSTTTMMDERYQAMLQLGHINQGGHYHRVAQTAVPPLKFLSYEDKIGNERVDSYNTVVTEFADSRKMLLTSFNVAPVDNEAAIEFITTKLASQIDKIPNKEPDKYFAFDVSDMIGQKMITNNEDRKKEAYVIAYREAKGHIDQILKLSAEKFKEMHPKLPLSIQEIHDYLRETSGFTTTAKLEDNLFATTCYTIDSSTKNNHFLNEFRTKFHDWSKVTGASLGAMTTRRLIAKTNTPESLCKIGPKRYVEYAPLGDVNYRAYLHRHDFLNTQSFKNLEEIAQNPKKFGTGQALLASSTCRLTNALFNQISREQWEDLHSDPIRAELIQTSLTKAKEHLGNAAFKAFDFVSFVQAIDRFHSELTTLLSLAMPFDLNRDFITEYSEYISQMLPRSLESRVGLGRSAMNLYAGINTTLLEVNPDATIISEDHSYYEEAMVTGPTPSLKAALKDPSITKIDLFTTEFYHNIDADTSVSEYKKVNVEKHIKDIFRQKPATDSLTVAIDATIDFTNSTDLQKLLKTFEREINQGRLNIIVFRSGQKFDMLGLDNYFGAPFYMINNGATKWNHFNNLFEEPQYQAEELSSQYFAMMAKAGVDMTDSYKKQVFDNTQKIHKIVPLALRPGMNRHVYVANSGPGNKAPFIEITPCSNDPNDAADLFLWIQEQVMDVFNSNQKLMYNRGSFGFPLPNMASIVDEKLRINPGIDPDETRLYAELFRRIEAHIKTIGQ